MKISLPDSCYIEIKPINPKNDVWLNDQSTDMWLGFAYLGVLLFTVYLKRR